MELQEQEIINSVIEKLSPEYLFIIILLVLVPFSLLIIILVLIPKTIKLFDRIELIHHNTNEINDAVNHKEPNETTLREKVKNIEKMISNMSNDIVFMKQMINNINMRDNEKNRKNK